MDARPTLDERLAAHVTDANRDAVAAAVAAVGGVELTCAQLRDPRAFKHVDHPLRVHFEAFCAAAGIEHDAPWEPGAPFVWDIAERAWALLVERHLLPRLDVDVVLGAGSYNSAYARYVDGLLHNDDRLDDTPVRSVTATGADVATAFCDTAAGDAATRRSPQRASTLTAGLAGLVGRRVEVRIGGDGADDQLGRLLAVTDDAFVLGDVRDDTAVLVVPRELVRAVCTHQLTADEVGAVVPAAAPAHGPHTDHLVDPPGGPSGDASDAGDHDGEDRLRATLGRGAALKEGPGSGAVVLRRPDNQDRELLSDLLADQLPWLRWLPETDRTECVRELVDDLAASVDTDNFIRFHQDLVAWRNTAEVWSDPERAEQLAGPFGEPGGEAERPTTDG